MLMLKRIVVIQEFENEQIAKLAYQNMKSNPVLPFQLPLQPRRVYAEQIDNKVTLYIIFKGD